MTLYLVEHFSDKGVRSYICETLKGARIMVSIWRREDDRKARITMLTGFCRTNSADDIRYIPMCKEIIEDIRFEVEQA